MPEGEGRWLSVGVDDLKLDDRVRVTHRRRAQEVHEGVVLRLHPGAVSVRHSASQPDGEYFHQSYRTFERWTPYELGSTETGSEFTWERVTDFTTLSPGDYLRSTAAHLATPSVEGEFDRLTGSSRLRLAGRQGLFYTDPNVRTWERRVPGRAQVGEPTGWIPVTDISTLQVGDIVRATPNGIGGRMQARVTSLDPFAEGGYTALTTHVITPSSNGTARDLRCFGADGYIYGDTGHNTEVWRGVMPAPAPEQVVPVVQREMSIPEWATSLDRARRYVHEAAWDLEAEGSNCTDGTRDFLVEADLPEEREWPEPDESAEIRAFLLKVREAALSTASHHGKSLRQVEEWLTLHGITAPAPAETQHTVTFTAPAGADVAQVMRDLGWTVQA